MRINKREKLAKRSEIRSLKIQPRCRFNKWSTSIVPELILRGKWLEEFGFEKEIRVTIHASENLIVILPQKREELVKEVAKDICLAASKLDFIKLINSCNFFNFILSGSTTNSLNFWIQKAISRSFKYG